jgi:Zn-dependent peptidase ImmA (M78 family)
VVAWEAGEASPTVAKLRSIADLFKQPMALFFTPAPPVSSVRLPPDFRSVGAATGRGLAREIRLAEERRDTFKQLAPEAVSAAAWPRWSATGKLAPAEVRDRLRVSVAAVAAARTANESLRLWITAVENQGVLVFQMSRVGDGDCSGFAVDDPTTPVIVLNGKDAPQRRAFTLLHELGHLLGHSGGLCLLDEDDDRERTCNRFAESVLMPTDEVRRAIAEAQGREAVDVVEKRFHVSRLAAAVALRRHGLVAQSVVDYEKQRSDEARKQPPARSGFARPERLKRRNLGDVYLTAVLDAMDRDMISVTDATYFLGAKVEMIGKLERELAGNPR